VGLRAGLDTEVKKKSFASAGDRTPVVQSVTRHYTAIRSDNKIRSLINTAYSDKCQHS
jgi:hypothetical protein